MITTRTQAETNHKEKLAALRATEMGSCEQAYEIALADYNQSVATLVEMEIKFPTKRESIKRTNYLRLVNRGLDLL